MAGGRRRVAAFGATSRPRHMPGAAPAACPAAGTCPPLRRAGPGPGRALYCRSWSKGRKNVNRGGGGGVTGPETNRAGKGPGSARAAASSTRGPLSALRTGLRPPRLNLTEVAALGPGSERGSPCPP